MLVPPPPEGSSQLRFVSIPVNLQPEVVSASCQELFLSPRNDGGTAPIFPECAETKPRFNLAPPRWHLLHPQRGACCHRAVDFPSALTLFLTNQLTNLYAFDMSSVQFINVCSLDLEHNITPDIVGHAFSFLGIFGN